MMIAVVLFCACQGPAQYGSPSPQVGPDVFTIAVLPDTQMYSQFYPDIFMSQTSWLASERERLALELVVHVGDLVEASWALEQWEVARSAMGLLDGHAPYLIAPGNHDYGKIYEERNARTRSTHLHDLFPPSLFEAMPSFGGFFPEDGRVDNSYHTFRAGQQDWLVMALEFGPRDAVLAWADEVLASHPEHFTIIATHAYLYDDDTRFAYAIHGGSQLYSPYEYGVGSSPEGVNDGEDIWNVLMVAHPQIVAVVCGHMLGDGLGYARSQGAGEVHEILANYQMNDLGGAGYMRLMHFDTASRNVEVRTYSPWLDDYDLDMDNQFTFSY
jgi:hypothetical protein